VLGGQWFPKVGVFRHGAWNCHQYHALTEFFADFGVYDVRLTVPQFESSRGERGRVGEVNNKRGHTHKQLVVFRDYRSEGTS